MFSPELNEMYARERQRDFLQEAADATHVGEARAARPRPGASLVARLGQWFQRPRWRPASAALPRRQAPVTGD